MLAAQGCSHICRLLVGTQGMQKPLEGSNFPFVAKHTIGLAGHRNDSSWFLVLDEGLSASTVMSFPSQPILLAALRVGWLAFGRRDMLLMLDHGPNLGRHDNR